MLKLVANFKKISQLRGASVPPNRGFAPVPHWGLCPQTPYKDSRYALVINHLAFIKFCPPQNFVLDPPLIVAYIAG